MKKRILTYNTSTLSIIEHYKKLDMVRKIKSDNSADEVGFLSI